MQDGVRAGGIRNAAQQVRELKYDKKAGKRQGEAECDERTDSLVVESALANHVQRLPSVCGSAERNGAINYRRRRRRSPAAATSGVKRLKAITKNKINSSPRRERTQSQRMLPDDLWVTRSGVPDLEEPLGRSWCSGR